MKNDMKAMKLGILYLVPTPIGNMGDMTYRAVEVLSGVSLIAAEDTRTSQKLLNHYGIKTRLISYHKFNESQRTAILLAELAQGKDIALISEAGTPGISDPASIVVNQAIQKGFQVVCLPGATACITALAASGLPTGSFIFYGFLPGRQRDRAGILDKLKQQPETIILYEAAHRIVNTLKELAANFGARPAVVAREISKLHETYLRGNLTDLAQLKDMETRGEFVILIQGRPPEPISDEQLIIRIRNMLKRNIRLKDISATLATETGATPNRIYQLALHLKKDKAS